MFIKAKAVYYNQNSNRYEEFKDHMLINVYQIISVRTDELPEQFRGTIEKPVFQVVTTTTTSDAVIRVTSDELENLVFENPGGVPEDKTIT